MTCFAPPAADLRAGCRQRLPRRYRRTGAATCRNGRARGPATPAAALNDILARYLEIQGDGLNAMPLRLQLEFLDRSARTCCRRNRRVRRWCSRCSRPPRATRRCRAGRGSAAVLPPPAPSLDRRRSRRGAPRPSSSPSRKSPRCAARSRRSTRSIRRPTPYADHSAGGRRASRSSIRGSRCRTGCISATASCSSWPARREIVLSFDFARARRRERSAPAAAAARLGVPQRRRLAAAGRWSRTRPRASRATARSRWASSSDPTARRRVAGHVSCWIRGAGVEPHAARADRRRAGRLSRAIRACRACTAPWRRRRGARRRCGAAARVRVVGSHAEAIILDRRLPAARRHRRCRRSAGATIGTIVSAPAVLPACRSRVRATCCPATSSRSTARTRAIVPDRRDGAAICARRSLTRNRAASSNWPTRCRRCVPTAPTSRACCRRSMSSARASDSARTTCRSTARISTAHGSTSARTSSRSASSRSVSPRSTSRARRRSAGAAPASTVHLDLRADRRSRDWRGSRAEYFNGAALAAARCQRGIRGRTAA